MRKKLPKLLIIFFVVIFVAQLLALGALLLMPAMVGAQVTFTPQVQIGDYAGGTVDKNSIGNYIKALYKYGVGVVGIFAAAVMMFGGLLWLTAGGDSGKVSEAKEWIKSSLLGLILALLSYTILLTINPDLVNFRPITITPIKETTGSNPRNNGSVDYMDVSTIFYNSV